VTDLRDVYTRELALLRDLASEFAAAHPDAANHLDVRGADPGVERLIQAVAFSNARLRMRLDDDFPELSQLLLRWIWPELLRPIPAVAIQQFSHQHGRVVRIPAGARVRSREIKPTATSRQRTAVHFETVDEVPVTPLSVEHVREIRGGRHGAVEIRLVSEEVPIAEVLAQGIDSLRFFVDDPDEAVANALLRALLTSASTSLRVGGTRHALPAPRHVGLDPDERLLSGWSHESHGRRLLHELFVAPERFRFVEFAGLGGVSVAPEAMTLDLVVELSAELQDAGRLRAENLLLGCTPIVNRFEASASPVQRPPHEDAYPLQVRALPPGCYEILDVTAVRGSVRHRDGRTHAAHYRPRIELMSSERPAGAWFDLRLREHPITGDVHTWLLLSTPEDPTSRERISAELVCSNGNLASALRRGDVTHAVSSVPAGVEMTNLTVPSPSTSPDVGASSVWQLLGLLHSSGSPLGDLAALRNLIGLHDPRGRRDELGRQRRRTRIEAIASVESKAQDRLVPVRLLDPASGVSRLARAPCRGAGVRIEVDMVALGGPGHTWLFGSILERFLTEYVSLNAFSQLSLADVENRYQEMAWAPRLGRRDLV
jgi:type VI secretion system protein ImpG